MYQEQQVNRLHTYLKQFGSLVLGFGLLFSSGYAAEYFVDKGHVDGVSGISFEIKPPYLNEKKAFNLRAKNLSPWQLQQISDAMPFIAAFTNEGGDRVVSFQVDDLSYAYSFAGNYYPEKASNGVRVGRGWRLDNNLSFKNMIASNAPQWATLGHAVKYTTLEKYLKNYQKSSQFTELV